MRSSRTIADILILVSCWRLAAATRILQPQSTTIPLLNFTLFLSPAVPDTDLLLQSIQDYLQVGLLYDIQNVTLQVVEEPFSEPSSSGSYSFGPGALRMEQDTANDMQEVIQKEQVSLLNDKALLEYVLQQDFSNPDLQVLRVQMEHEITNRQSSNPGGMFASSLSNAQKILLLTVSVLVVFSTALVVCVRRYRRLQVHHKPLKLKLAHV